MLIVIGDAQAARGKRDQLLAAATAMAASTRADDGCEFYGFYADISNPDLILGVEMWRDQTALDAHLDHDHTSEFLATVPGLVAGTPVMRFFSAEPNEEIS